MKNIFIIAACCAAIHSCTVTKTGVKTTTPEPKLLGVHTEQSMRTKPYNTWFQKNYDEYKTDSATAEQLIPLLANKEIEIYMGTWCGDSKREVPRMLKILNYCHFPADKLKIIMVDNEDSTYKQSPTHEERNLNIHRVPDLIVFEKNAELGRIVESPVISLEKDLLTILKKEEYSTSYKGIYYLINQFKLQGIDGVEKDSVKITAALKTLLKHKFELNPYGRISLNTGETKKAILIYTLNTMAYPAEADVFFRLGSIYQQTGNKEKAKENLEKAIILKPDYPEAKKKLEELK